VLIGTECRVSSGRANACGGVVVLDLTNYLVIAGCPVCWDSRLYETQ
jgi:hypothetical protein